jgi:hypothetical protein
MVFKNLNIKPFYESDVDDLLNDFYIPVLQESVQYDRLAGFFSSQSLAIAARGIIGLIKNGGRLRLIMSPNLNNGDLMAINDSLEKPEKYIEKKLLDDVQKLEDEFVRDHVYALGWMLANNKLEIKIAIPHDNNKPFSLDNNNSIFHVKVGILRDSENNTITFSGSLNESAKGWLGGCTGNTEEFKVFKSWLLDNNDWMYSDINKFEKFWNNISPNVKIIDLPEAVKEKLISQAPSNYEELNLEKWYNSQAKKILLFEHQIKAVESWLKFDMEGILEMATGTGKTITALECISRAIDNVKGNWLIIICVPYHHLVTQWEDNINKFGFNCEIIIADSTNRKYKTQLSKKILEDSIPYKKTRDTFVITTHNTFSSDDFISIINSATDKTNLMLVADEVHWLGASKLRNGLLESYKFRLGLSATPRRWFDDDGTHILYSYFNENDINVHYSYSLKDALTNINPTTNETYLTPYYYYPYFVYLNDEELLEYNRLTLSIVQLFNKSKNALDEDHLQNLLFRRSNIAAGSQRSGHT